MLNLTHLSVVNERVGDEIVALVRAATPGRLQHLELVDVDLTDEGAEALAGLPQLQGVTSLNLEGNELTRRGLVALCRSPHLKNLTSLHIGGKFFNPYYDYLRSQKLGDEGAAILACSPLLDSLEKLALANAGVGTAGVIALLSSPRLGRLRHLDLSMNPFGLEQMPILDRRFDDEAARALAGSRFFARLDPSNWPRPRT